MCIYIRIYMCVHVYKYIYIYVYMLIYALIDLFIHLSSLRSSQVGGAERRAKSWMALRAAVGEPPAGAAATPNIDENQSRF